MIINPHIPKRKKKKPNAKARALQASWQDILDKYEIQVPKVVVPVTRSVGANVRRPGSDTSHIPSLSSNVGSTTKKDSPKYTGDNMLGVGQLHKSNAVPIFKQEDAVAISQMRRN